MNKMNTMLVSLLCICSPALTAAPSIAAKDAARAIKSGDAVLVDVRELDEIKADGMAAPARWLATSEATQDNPKFKSFVASLDKQKKIILYCRSGRRSGALAETLEKQGFQTANMGAFKDWAAAGLEVKKAP